MARNSRDSMSVDERMTGQKHKPYSTQVVKIHGVIGKETEKAIQFTIVDKLEDAERTESEWFPHSQILSIHREKSLVTGKLDSMVVTQWLAKKKGLAY